jgi:hypothetical protein
LNPAHATSPLLAWVTSTPHGLLAKGEVNLPRSTLPITKIETLAETGQI